MQLELVQRVLFIRFEVKAKEPAQFSNLRNVVFAAKTRDQIIIVRFFVEETEDVINPEHKVEDGVILELVVNTRVTLARLESKISQTSINFFVPATIGLLCPIKALFEFADIGRITNSRISFHELLVDRFRQFWLAHIDILFDDTIQESSLDIQVSAKESMACGQSKNDSEGVVRGATGENVSS